MAPPENIPELNKRPHPDDKLARPDVANQDLSGDLSDQDLSAGMDDQDSSADLSACLAADSNNGQDQDTANQQIPSYDRHLPNFKVTVKTGATDQATPTDKGAAADEPIDKSQIPLGVLVARDEQGTLCSYSVKAGKIQDQNGKEVGSFKENGEAVLNGKKIQIGKDKDTTFHGIGSDGLDLHIFSPRNSKNLSGLLTSLDGKEQVALIAGQIFDSSGAFLGAVDENGLIEFANQPGKNESLNSRFNRYHFKGEQNGKEREFFTSANNSNGTIFIPQANGQRMSCTVLMGMVVNQAPGDQLGYVVPPRISATGKLEDGIICLKDRNNGQPMPLAGLRGATLNLQIAGQTGVSGENVSARLQGLCLGADLMADGNIRPDQGILNIHQAIANEGSLQRKLGAEWKENDDSNWWLSPSHITGSTHAKMQEETEKINASRARAQQLKGCLNTSRMNETDISIVQSTLTEGKLQASGSALAFQRQALDAAKAPLEPLPADHNKISGTVKLTNASGNPIEWTINKGVISTWTGRKIGTIYGTAGLIELADSTKEKPLFTTMKSITGAVWNLNIIDDKGKSQKLEWASTGDALVSRAQISATAYGEHLYASALNKIANNHNSRFILKNTAATEQKCAQQLANIFAYGIKTPKDMDLLKQGGHSVLAKGFEEIKAAESQVVRQFAPPIDIPKLNDKSTQTVNGSLRIGTDIYKITNGQLFRQVNEGVYNEEDGSYSDFELAACGQLNPDYTVDIQGQGRLSLAAENRVLLEMTMADGVNHQLIGLGAAHMTDGFGYVTGGLLDVQELQRQCKEHCKQAEANNKEYFEKRPYLTGSLASWAMGNRDQLLRDFATTIGKNNQLFANTASELFKTGFNTSTVDNTTLDTRIRFTQSILSTVGTQAADTNYLAQEATQLQKQINDGVVMAAVTMATFGLGSGFAAAANGQKIISMGRMGRVMLAAGELGSSALAGGLISVAGRYSDDSKFTNNLVSGLFEGSTMAFAGVSGKVIGNAIPLSQAKTMLKLSKAGATLTPEQARLSLALSQNLTGRMISAGTSDASIHAVRVAGRVLETATQANGFHLAGQAREGQKLEIEPGTLFRSTALMLVGHGAGVGIGKYLKTQSVKAAVSSTINNLTYGTVDALPAALHNQDVQTAANLGIPVEYLGAAKLQGRDYIAAMHEAARTGATAALTNLPGSIGTHIAGDITRYLGAPKRGKIDLSSQVTIVQASKPEDLAQPAALVTDAHQIISQPEYTTLPTDYFLGDATTGKPADPLLASILPSVILVNQGIGTDYPITSSDQNAVQPKPAQPTAPTPPVTNAQRTAVPPPTETQAPTDTANPVPKPPEPASNANTTISNNFQRPDTMNEPPGSPVRTKIHNMGPDSPDGPRSTGDANNPDQPDNPNRPTSPKLTPADRNYIASGAPEEPGFVQSVLGKAGPGKPGMTVERTFGKLNSPEIHITYRDPQGKPLARAVVVRNFTAEEKLAERTNTPPKAKWLVRDLAADKTRGLLAHRAAVEVGRELNKLGAIEPSGSISPDARAFLIKGQKLLAKSAKTDGQNSSTSKPVENVATVEQKPNQGSETKESPKHVEVSSTRVDRFKDGFPPLSGGSQEADGDPVKNISPEAKPPSPNESKPPDERFYDHRENVGQIPPSDKFPLYYPGCTDQMYSGDVNRYAQAYLDSTGDIPEELFNELLTKSKYGQARLEGLDSQQVAQILQKQPDRIAKLDLQKIRYKYTLKDLFNNQAAEPALDCLNAITDDQLINHVKNYGKHFSPEQWQVLLTDRRVNLLVENKLLANLPENVLIAAMTEPRIAQLNAAQIYQLHLYGCAKRIFNDENGQPNLARLNAIEDRVVKDLATARNLGLFTPEQLKILLTDQRINLLAENGQLHALPENVLDYIMTPPRIGQLSNEQLYDLLIRGHKNIFTDENGQPNLARLNAITDQHLIDLADKHRLTVFTPEQLKVLITDKRIDLFAENNCLSALPKTVLASSMTPDHIGKLSTEQLHDLLIHGHKDIFTDGNGQPNLARLNAITDQQLIGYATKHSLTRFTHEQLKVLITDKRIDLLAENNCLGALPGAIRALQMTPERIGKLSTEQLRDLLIHGSKDIFTDESGQPNLARLNAITDKQFLELAAKHSLGYFDPDQLKILFTESRTLALLEQAEYPPKEIRHFITPAIIAKIESETQVKALLRLNNRGVTDGIFSDWAGRPNLELLNALTDKQFELAATKDNLNWCFSPEQIKVLLTDKRIEFLLQNTTAQFSNREVLRCLVTPESIGKISPEKLSQMLKAGREDLFNNQDGQPDADCLNALSDAQVLDIVRKEALSSLSPEQSKVLFTDARLNLIVSNNLLNKLAVWDNRQFQSIIRPDNIAQLDAALLSDAEFGHTWISKCLSRGTGTESDAAYLNALTDAQALNCIQNNIYRFSDAQQEMLFNDARMQLVIQNNLLDKLPISIYKQKMTIEMIATMSLSQMQALSDNNSRAMRDQIRACLRTPRGGIDVDKLNGLTNDQVLSLARNGSLRHLDSEQEKMLFTDARIKLLKDNKLFYGIPSSTLGKAIDFNDIAALDRTQMAAFNKAQLVVIRDKLKEHFDSPVDDPKDQEATIRDRIRTYFAGSKDKTKINNFSNLTNDQFVALAKNGSLRLLTAPHLKTLLTEPRTQLLADQQLLHRLPAQSLAKILPFERLMQLSPEQMKAFNTAQLAKIKENTTSHFNLSEGKPHTERLNALSDNDVITLAANGALRFLTGKQSTVLLTEARMNLLEKNELLHGLSIAALTKIITPEHIDRLTNEQIGKFDAKQLRAVLAIPETIERISDSQFSFLYQNDLLPLLTAKQVASLLTAERLKVLPPDKFNLLKPEQIKELCSDKDKIKLVSDEQFAALSNKSNKGLLELDAPQLGTLVTNERFETLLRDSRLAEFTPGQLQGIITQPRFKNLSNELLLACDKFQLRALLDDVRTKWLSESHFQELLTQNRLGDLFSSQLKQLITPKRVPELGERLVAFSGEQQLAILSTPEHFAKLTDNQLDWMSSSTHRFYPSQIQQMLLSSQTRNQSEQMRRLQESLAKKLIASISTSSHASADLLQYCLNNAKTNLNHLSTIADKWPSLSQEARALSPDALYKYVLHTGSIKRDPLADAQLLTIWKSLNPEGKLTWNDYAANLAWQKTFSDLGQESLSGQIPEETSNKLVDAYKTNLADYVKLKRDAVLSRLTDTNLMVNAQCPTLDYQASKILAATVNVLVPIAANDPAQVKQNKLEQRYQLIKNIIPAVYAENINNILPIRKLSIADPNRLEQDINTNWTWECKSMLALTNIFGKDSSKWLEAYSKRFRTNSRGAYEDKRENELLHDATAWLPLPDMAHYANRGPEIGIAGKPNDAIDGLSTYLLVHIKDKEQSSLEMIASNWRELKEDYAKYNARIKFEWENAQELNLACLPSELPDEPSKMPVDELVKHIRARVYANRKNNEFAMEAAHWGVKNEKYQDAINEKGTTKPGYESRYIASLEIPAAFPTTPRWQVGNLTGRFLHRNDPRGLFLGKHTDCCQYPGGANGYAAWHGQTSSEGGFFVIEDKKGNVVAQSWAWKSPSGGLCFDNCEGKGLRGTSREKLVIDMYNKVAEELSATNFDQKRLGKDFVPFHTITLGTGYSKISLQSWPGANGKTLPPPKDYDEVRDSYKQKLLKHNPALAKPPAKAEDKNSTSPISA